ncbi:MAG: hypothetical protein U9Q33_04260 [Campylobacterota bacterium]|nr:hypothetical protein [Campylobacterota bacterium]
MKTVEVNSINTRIIHRQSLSSGVLSDGFSSLLNQDKKDSSSEQEESRSKNLNTQHEILQNRVYLNKAALGIGII